MNEVQGRPRCGRPTAYRTEYDRLAKNYCMLGATDAELAMFFEVSETSIQNWKRAHPTFLSNIKAGRAIADSKVARALFERAIGYCHPEQRVFVREGEVTVVETIKHFPPDTAAASLWLRNRQPTRWRARPAVSAGRGAAARSERTAFDLSLLSDQQRQQYWELLRRAG